MRQLFSWASLSSFSGRLRAFCIHDLTQNSFFSPKQDKGTFSHFHLLQYGSKVLPPQKKGKFPATEIAFTFMRYRRYINICGSWKKLARNVQKLKADRPHLRKYPHTPTDYRHTDKHLGLVMAPIALNCTRQSRDGRTDGRTDRWTDGRYQVHYLPRFAVDKNLALLELTKQCWRGQEDTSTQGCIVRWNMKVKHARVWYCYYSD